MTVGERIQKIRKAKGLTQKDLGVLSGTSEITVRQYEIGKRQPRLEQLLLIADALGVSSGELIGEDKSPYDDFDKVSKILKFAGISFECSDIFDDYFVWPSGSKDPQEDRVEFVFSDLVEIVLSVENDSEVIKQQFIKKELFSRIFRANPRYRAETAPQSPPAPQEGKDTTPPPDAPETPPEGE